MHNNNVSSNNNNNNIKTTKQQYNNNYNRDDDIFVDQTMIVNDFTALSRPPISASFSTKSRA